MNKTATNLLTYLLLLFYSDVLSRRIAPVKAENIGGSPPIHRESKKGDTIPYLVHIFAKY